MNIFFGGERKKRKKEELGGEMEVCFLEER